MVEEKDQVLAEVTQEVEQPGGTQVETLPAEVQVEAVKEPQEKAPVEKTYTHKEWQEREATIHREVAQYRKGLADLALQAQIREAQNAEALAQSRDLRDVQTGVITEDVAAQRQRERMDTLQQQAQIRQQQGVVQQQMGAAQQVLAQAEVAGRILAAQDLANEYNVDAQELLGDKAIKNYDQMKASALNLAFKALKTKPEKFDSGQKGGQGSYDESLKARYPTMFKK